MANASASTDTRTLARMAGWTVLRSARLATFERIVSVLKVLDLVAFVCFICVLQIMHVCDRISCLSLWFYVQSFLHVFSACYLETSNFA
jgi:hypothetical protein